LGVFYKDILSTIPIIKLKQKNKMISNDRSSYFILSMFFQSFSVGFSSKKEEY